MSPGKHAHGSTAHTDSGWRKLPRWVETITLSDTLTWLWTIAKNSPTAAFSALLAVIATLYIALDDSTVIGTISVPPVMTEQGYTSEVFAQKISDAAQAEVAAAKTVMRKKGIEPLASDRALLLASDTSTIVGVGTNILRFLRLSRRTYISGEVTVDQQAYQLKLRRDDGGVIPEIGPQKDPRALVASAADAIVDQTQPYLRAVLLYYQRGGNAALAQLARIFARLPPNDSNVIYGLGMEGNILEQQGNLAGAEAVLHDAIGRDGNVAMLHLNLGNVLLDKGRPRDALAEYKIAARLSPEYPEAHANLALAYKTLGDFDNAQKEFEASFALDAQKPVPRLLFADMLRNQHQLAKATMQCRTALRIDRNAAKQLAIMGASAYHFGSAEGILRTGLLCDDADGDTHLLLAEILIDEAHQAAASGMSKTASTVATKLAEACMQIRAGRAGEPAHAVQTLARLRDLEGDNSCP